MDTNRLTEKALESLQASQQAAIEHGNSQIEPLHLFYALLSQEEGLIPSLLEKMNIDAAGMTRQTADALSRLPKIAGAAQQPGFSAAFSSVLNGAEEEMRKMGDEYISVEHLFLALLNKPEGRVVDVNADYNGFEIENEFVVGYGLDFNQHYRCLPYVGVLKEECYQN